MWVSLVAHAYPTPLPSHFFLFDPPTTMWWGVRIMKLLFVYFSPASYYCLPARLKCSTHHSCPLWCPRSVFFLDSKAQVFALTQNNTVNCSFAYSNLHIFRNISRRRHILNRSVAGLLRICLPSNNIHYTCNMLVISTVWYQIAKGFFMCEFQCSVTSRFVNVRYCAVSL